MAERFLGGLATVVSRRRRAVVAAWLALLAAGGWFSLHQSDHLSGGGWQVPGSPSLRASDALSTDFPRVTPGVFVVFVTNRDGPRRRLQEVRRLVAREPAVRPGRPIVLDGGRAAILPLGFVAVILSGAVIYGLSRSFEISVYVTNMASMIGIGVAVDYSLFIVSRFRRELHRGMSTGAALGRAMSSSGTAVVFSGLTVAVSLAALFTIDVNALRSMAVGAIVVVCISVLASVTLLPALLSAAGTRVDRLRLPLPWRTTEAGSDAFWGGWAKRVMRRPVAGFAAGAAVMLVLAVPFFWMQTYNRGLDELPHGAEGRVATERAHELTGPGFGAPVHVLTHGNARVLARRLAAIPGIAHVAAPVRSVDGSYRLVDATLSVPVESSEARAIVRRVQRVAGNGAHVGGRP